MNKRLLMALSVLVCLVVGCDTTSSDDDIPLLTPTQVYAHPITDLVGQTITVETRLVWKVYAGEPWSKEYPDTLYTTQLSMSFEDVRQVVPEHIRQSLEQHEGVYYPPENVRVFSQGLSAVRIHGGVTEPWFWRYDGQRLDSTKAYRITGKISYFDYVLEMELVDSDFINNTNANPTSWIDTFRFDASSIESVQ